MIEPNYFWINIFLLGMGTLTIRSTFIAMSSRIIVRPRWRQIFSYIPAAVLPAFVAPAVFYHEGHQTLIFGKERFLVLVLSTAVCFYSKNTLLTILFGLTVLFFLN